MSRRRGEDVRWMLLAGIVLFGAGCQTGLVHEPWMNSSAEQVKRAWLSAPPPALADEMRTRMVTTQTDR